MHLAALKTLAFVAVTAALLLQSTKFPLTSGGLGCISASSNAIGAPVVAHTCSTEDPSKHEWDFTRVIDMQTPVPQPYKIFDVTDGINADGTKLQVWTCVDGNTNQQWIESVNDLTFRWAGTDKCIDLTDGNLTDGNQLQIWTCDLTRNNQNQRWAIKPPLALQQVGSEIGWRGGGVYQTTPCLSASSNTDGAGLVFDNCVEPGGDVTWDTVPSSGSTGQIKTFDGTKCLDVRDGNGTNGNPLQIWSCVEGNINQLWNMDIDGPENSGGKLISWAGTNKCVRAFEIWDCDPNDRYQWWVALPVYSTN
ncbi:hypothetical protein E1B28_007039 [Marasmius oreades]|uniref:Ricin B lectin domain-containing protein n=1 Tax=Marasmius oreades TaxID=181124 RepID=A0A9P7S100_9AGAR|nr:uncharacterized protein E1B28_007039 [Marasmius oreades]KAG7093357.1 hypothetical protein E1B28_007039 [Marasmius oreades]